MKFLTFADLHGDRKFLKELIKRAAEDDIDFIVCAGDISEFGKNLRYYLKEFNSIGKRFYTIPSNHEDNKTLSKAIKELENCINIHQEAVELGDYVILGYGEGGFAIEDAEFRKIARSWYGKYKDKKVILITHGPPYATKLDIIGKRHVGNKDYRKFIERIKPKLAISGHLHESIGVIDNIDKTKLVNPGWEGMVVELN